MNVQRLYQKLIWVFLFVIVAIAAKGIIFSPSDISTLTAKTFAGHEWQYNIFRLVALGDAFSEGMTGRWIDNFSVGWGYPIFHYTGPLPYTLGALLLNAGFEPVSALNLSWFLAYAGAGITMFWATRTIFGNWGALLASTCYLLAPYHLVDTYVRTNLVETSAFIFPPLILRALWIARERMPAAVLLGAMAVMLLPLTHLLSTYLIGLGLGVFTLCYCVFLPRERRGLFFSSALLMSIFGLFLSAFFWFPAVVDITVVRGFQAITEGYYHYSNHFVYPHQLVSDFWAYGGSEAGPRDFMSFSLGLVSVLIASSSAVLALFYSAHIVIKEYQQKPQERGPELVSLNDVKVTQENREFLTFIIAAVLSATAMAYMTLQASDWLWKILPGVESVQFPWRFLFPASFFLAICAGGLPRLLIMLRPKWAAIGPLVAIVLMSLVIHSHWDFAKEGSYFGVDRADMTDEHHREIGIWTTNTHEFMPVDVSTIPWTGSGPNKPIEFMSSSTVNANRIAQIELGHGWAEVRLLPGAAGTLQFQQHWHPGWKANIDGVAVDTFPQKDNKFAPIAVQIPENAYAVSFRYGYTQWGQWGLWLSFFAAVLGLAWLIYIGNWRIVKIAVWPALLLLIVIGFYAKSAEPESFSQSQRMASIEKVITLEELQVRKFPGSRWNAKGNHIMDSSGLVINMGETLRANLLELSLDHNDTYLLGFLLDGKLIAADTAGVDNSHGGMMVKKMTIPNQAKSNGFDQVAIIPVAGDGYYSIGHLIVE